MIRLPDIPGYSGAAINAPQVNPSAVAAPAQALGHVAGAIAGVSEQFHDTAVRIQKIENARTISEKRQQLASEYANLQLELQKDPDPASRLTRTRDFLGQMKGLMDSGDLPPAVRDELGQHFDGFATQAVIRQGEDSMRLSVTRSKQALKNEVDEGFRTQNRGAVEAGVKTATEAGALLPEEGEAILRKFDETSAMREAEEAIDADPLAAEKDLEDPDFLKKHPLLSPEAKESLERQAEHKANRYRSDFTNDIIISGEAPTPEDLQMMEEAGQIDKATHARWISKLRESAADSPPSDPAIYEETYGQIMAYDPSKDPSGRTEAQLRNWIASQSLPKAEIKVLNDKFNERLNPTKASKPKSVHEASFAGKIGTDFTRGDWGKYRFPVDHDNDPSTAPITPINKTEYDKAWKLRGQFTDQWRAIVNGLPEDASFETVNGAYEALKTSFKDKKPMPELNFSKPTATPFDPDTVYKATGANFGGQAIKPAGTTYTGASATVFGGKNDPADNGQSALGGTTGAGGREGTAIPQKLLQSKFPGKDKAWIDKNVRTVVRSPDGVMHSLSVADFGTAEWVWQRNGRPTLDLTEGAVKQLGGKVTYTPEGKLQSVKGLDNLAFSVVSTETTAPLKGASWDAAKSSWFQANRPTSNEQIQNSLIALRDRWNRENMPTGSVQRQAQLSDGMKYDPRTASPPVQPVMRPGDKVQLTPANTYAARNEGEFSDYNVIPE